MSCPIYKESNSSQSIIGYESVLTINPGYDNHFELYKNGEKVNNLKAKVINGEEYNIEVRRKTAKDMTEVEVLKKEIILLKQEIKNIKNKDFNPNDFLI